MNRLGFICIRRAAHAVLFVPALLLLAAGCLLGAGDECQGGQANQCHENAIRVCQPRQCAEPGCSGTQWQDTSCDNGTTCVVTSIGAECLLSPVKDAACHGNGYCSGSKVVHCSGGYAYGPSEDCRTSCGSQECIEVDEQAACSREVGCPDNATEPLSCDAPRACGSLVNWRIDPGVAPLAQGGAISDCHYTLSEAHSFLPMTADTPAFRETLLFAGHTLGATLAVDSSVGQPLARSGSYSTSGTNLIWDVSCQSGTRVSAPITYAYSATPNQLTLYEPARQLLYVYDRAP